MQGLREGSWPRWCTAASAVIVALATLTASASFSAPTSGFQPADDDEFRPWAHAFGQWISVETYSSEPPTILNSGTSGASPGDASQTVFHEDSPWASVTIDDGQLLIGPEGYVQLSPGEEQALIEENGFALARSQSWTAANAENETPALNINMTPRLALVPMNHTDDGGNQDEESFDLLSVVESEARAEHEPLDAEIPWWAVGAVTEGPVVSELRLSIDAISSSATLGEDGPAQLDSSLKDVRVELESPLLPSVVMASLSAFQSDLEPPTEPLTFLWTPSEQGFAITEPSPHFESTFSSDDIFIDFSSGRAHITVSQESAAIDTAAAQQIMGTPSEGAVEQILMNSVDQFAREQFRIYAANTRTEDSITRHGELIARISADPHAEGEDKCATLIQVTDASSWQELIDLQSRHTYGDFSLTSEEAIRESYRARCEAQSKILVDLIEYLETDFSVAETVVQPIVSVIAHTVAISAHYTKLAENTEDYSTARALTVQFPELQDDGPSTRSLPAESSSDGMVATVHIATSSVRGSGVVQPTDPTDEPTPSESPSPTPSAPPTETEQPSELPEPIEENTVLPPTLPEATQPPESAEPTQSPEPADPVDPSATELPEPTSSATSPAPTTSPTVEPPPLPAPTDGPSPENGPTPSPVVPPQDASEDISRPTLPITSTESTTAAPPNLRPSPSEEIRTPSAAASLTPGQTPIPSTDAPLEITPAEVFPTAPTSAASSESRDADLDVDIDVDVDDNVGAHLPPGRVHPQEAPAAHGPASPSNIAQTGATGTHSLLFSAGMVIAAGLCLLLAARRHRFSLRSVS